MACTSLTALPRACGAEGIVAGLEKVYVVSFNDLDTSSGSAYTTATNGLINTISLDASKKFVEVGILRSTANINESLTKNLQNGTGFWTQTLTLVLSDLTTENKTFIESVLNQPIAVMIKTRTGKYFAAGLNGLLELEKAEGGTGTAEGDLTGYTLTFTGTSTKSLQIVDPTIVSGLIA